MKPPRAPRVAWTAVVRAATVEEALVPLLGEETPDRATRELVGLSTEPDVKCLRLGATLAGRTPWSDAGADANSVGRGGAPSRSAHAVTPRVTCLSTSACCTSCAPRCERTNFVNPRHDTASINDEKQHVKRLKQEITVTTCASRVRQVSHDKSGTSRDKTDACVPVLVTEAKGTRRREASSKCVSTGKGQVETRVVRAVAKENGRHRCLRGKRNHVVVDVVHHGATIDIAHTTASDR